jgi:hypothetical protein
MNKLSATLFATFVCISPSAYAQAVSASPLTPQSVQELLQASSPAPQLVVPPGDPTIHRHFGFFLRPDLGVGFMATSEPTGTAAGDMTVSGLAGVFGFAIGGAIQENVILGAHVYDGVIVNPTVSLSSGQSATANASLTMVGIGPEFTYYWMPSNIYFSGTLALTRISLTANGTDTNSNVGFGTRLAVGKEWWVSDHWGMGLAGHASSSWNQDSGGGSQPMLTTWAFAVAFSATYN